VNPEEYRRMYSLEDHYWWFVGRRHLALALLRDAANRDGKQDGEKRMRVLDVGCGTGVVLRDVGVWTQAIGLDMSPIALALSKERGLSKLVKGRGEHLPIASNSVDAVIALDIFEHIEDDLAAITEVFRVLRSGGSLILSVPAFMSLWGPHDVALMHYRRYRRRQLRETLVKAGFSRPRISHSVFFLFPIVVLFRVFEKRKIGPAKASLPAVPGWMNSLLIGMQGFEAWLVRRISLPWGSSLVAVAKKTAQCG
jgi:SAM-dependent methyltransferase